MTGEIPELTRRTVLGTLLVGLGSVTAGCSRSSVDGAVVENETPLSLSHEYAVQTTPSGTRIVVDVTLTNDGNERITTDGRVPRLTCTFLDESDAQLHQSGLQLVEPLGVEETTELQFTVAVDVGDVTRYELRSEWDEA